MNTENYLDFWVVLIQLSVDMVEFDGSGKIAGADIWEGIFFRPSSRSFYYFYWRLYLGLSSSLPANIWDFVSPRDWILPNEFSVLSSSWYFFYWSRVESSEDLTDLLENFAHFVFYNNARFGAFKGVLWEI